MKFRSWMVITTLTLFFLIPGFSGAKSLELGSYRFGDRVVVKPDEVKAGDFIMAGADLEAAGEVKGDLTALGADVSHFGEVQGELKALGANVTLAGRYHQKVRAAAANLTLSGTFEGHVVAAAAKITLTPTAVIKGDFLYRCAVMERGEGSKILGKFARKEFRAQDAWVQKGKKAFLSLWIFFWVLSLPALILVGSLLHYFFPGYSEAVVAAVSDSPWKNIGVGLVFLVVVPFGVVLSLITLVGIPAGIIAGLLYGTALYISRIFVGVWMGRKVLGYFKKNLATAFFWPLVCGTLLTTLLIWIPVLGWFFRLFFLLIGLGAMWLVLWKSVQTRKAEPG
ncbi:MAG: polymer-forming cytoskeletal protein [Deltaproteobacteria bacterium]|nr:polymer-forming cytoskeletal protein [Deltaproteobacteria bacterium]